jgi:hypothetical protein
MNRRDLDLGLLAGLRITALPDGRVRVEPEGQLAHPDMDVPVEEYPSLKALIDARLKGGVMGRRESRPALRLVAAPAGATPSPALSPEAKARLIALPDPLRAWARAEPMVRLHLARHVLHGESLRDCLVSLARDLGPEGVSAVGERLREGELNTLAASFAVQLVRRRP